LDYVTATLKITQNEHKIFVFFFSQQFGHRFYDIIQSNAYVHKFWSLGRIHSLFWNVSWAAKKTSGSHLACWPPVWVACILRSYNPLRFDQFNTRRRVHYL